MRETLWGHDPAMWGFLAAILILAAVDWWRGK